MCKDQPRDHLGRYKTISVPLNVTTSIRLTKVDFAILSKLCSDSGCSRSAIITDAVSFLCDNPHILDKIVGANFVLSDFLGDFPCDYFVKFRINRKVLHGLRRYRLIYDFSDSDLIRIALRLFL